MKFGTYIHAPFVMNGNKFCDPLTFYWAPSSGQSFKMSNSLFYDLQK